MVGRRWAQIERIAEYIQEGLATAADLRQDSIQEYGTLFVTHITLAQVRYGGTWESEAQRAAPADEIVTIACARG